MEYLSFVFYRRNNTKDPEYEAFHQETNMAYSEIFRNVEAGLMVGNFCGNSIINITGNSFNLSLSDAVQVILNKYLSFLLFIDEIIL